MTFIPAALRGAYFHGLHISLHGIPIRARNCVRLAPSAFILVVDKQVFQHAAEAINVSMLEELPPVLILLRAGGGKDRCVDDGCFIVEFSAGLWPVSMIRSLGFLFRVMGVIGDEQVGANEAVLWGYNHWLGCLGIELHALLESWFLGVVFDNRLCYSWWTLDGMRPFHYRILRN